MATLEELLIHELRSELADNTSGKMHNKILKYVTSLRLSTGRNKLPRIAIGCGDSGSLS